MNRRISHGNDGTMPSFLRIACYFSFHRLRGLTYIIKKAGAFFFFFFCFTIAVFFMSTAKWKYFMRIKFRNVGKKTWGISITLFFTGTIILVTASWGRYNVCLQRIHLSLKRFNNIWKNNISHKKKKKLTWSSHFKQRVSALRTDEECLQIILEAVSRWLEPYRQSLQLI